MKKNRNTNRPWSDQERSDLVLLMHSKIPMRVMVDYFGRGEDALNRQYRNIMDGGASYSERYITPTARYIVNEKKEKLSILGKYRKAKETIELMIDSGKYDIDDNDEFLENLGDLD